VEDWNPQLYSRFEDQRTRPARELLQRVPPIAVRHAVDLGCGPGNSTELLVQRYPDADVLGIDTSEAMLRSARQRVDAARFEPHDVASWKPQAAPQLIFANAVLQWLGDHARLMPRLFGLLAPGGVLALQMPDNLDEPSHRLMHEVAALPPFSAAARDAGAQRDKPLSVPAYYDLLAATAEEVDIWHTVYRHPMADADAIVQWLRATGLRPFVDALPQAKQADFLAEYTTRIDRAYPARADGRRLLAFPRLFIVARRKPS